MRTKKISINARLKKLFSVIKYIHISDLQGEIPILFEKKLIGLTIFYLGLSLMNESIS